MKCRHCNKKIPDDSFFCPYCGLIVDDEAEYENERSPQVLWRPRDEKDSEIEDDVAVDNEEEDSFESDYDSDSRDDLEYEKEDISSKSRAQKAEWYARKPERENDKPAKKSSKSYIGVVGVIVLIMMFLIVAIWLIFSSLDVNEKRAREARQEELKAEEEKNRQQRKENLERNKGASKTDKADEEEEADDEAQDDEETRDITFSPVEEPEDFGEYYRLSVEDASASSVISQEGTDNSAIKAVDGSERTSWQEGVDGDGIGESLTLELAKPYRVKYLSLQLGNWNSEEYYEGNNRPKELEITIGDVTQNVTFPDGQTEYWLELSNACEASEIEFVIRSVYSGSQWQDTCIAEIGVYGSSNLGE